MSARFTPFDAAANRRVEEALDLLFEQGDGSALRALAMEAGTDVELLLASRRGELRDELLRVARELRDRLCARGPAGPLDEAAARQSADAAREGTPLRYSTGHALVLEGADLEALRRAVASVPPGAAVLLEWD